MRIKPASVGNFLITIVFCITCNQKNPVIPGHPSSSKIIGYAQKGPLLTGSSVSIREIDGHFTPGDQVCVLKTRSAAGDFEIDRYFESEYLEFRTEAYFYNEVIGAISDEPLMLRALATPFDSLDVNVNVLTTLTYGRIINLVENHDQSFVDAKEQAKREILKAFQIDIPGALPCDKMTIHREGESHAALLAISAIILGQQKTSDAALFMNKLTEDFKPDGAIDQPENRARLISNSDQLDCSAIRSHLETYWNEHDTTFPVPQFELFVKKILDFHIIKTVPPSNAADVLPGTAISIFFNKPVDMAALSGTAIRLSSARDEITGKIAGASNAARIDFLPDSLLLYNTIYIMTIVDTLYALDHSKILPGYSWQLMTTPEPVLEIPLDEIDFGAVNSESLLAVNNPSMEAVHWQITSSTNRLAVEPDSGSLAKAGQNIRLNLNREGLAPGEYRETLTIHTSCGDDLIPVRFEVPGHARLAVNPPVLTFGGDTAQKANATFFRNIHGGSE